MERCLTLRFFFAALRLCVKRPASRGNLMQRRQRAKMRKVKLRPYPDESILREMRCSITIRRLEALRVIRLSAPDFSLLPAAAGRPFANGKRACEVRSASTRISCTDD